MSHHLNRDQKGGKGRFKDSKSNRDFDVSELINFRYERPAAVQSTPNRSGRKSYPRSGGHHVSKAQFVQANFRFLLSPLTNPSEACLYDPDIIVPWQYVSCVILPKQLKGTTHSYAGNPAASSNDHPWVTGSSPTITAADYESVDDLNSDNVCPICLDETQVPRITSCGHTFCYTCILRHLQSELRNCDKCPICAVSLCASDLKTVLHVTDNLTHIFDPTPSTGTAEGTKSHRAGSMDSTSSTTHTYNTDIVGQEVDFTLLQLTKGSIVPQLATSDGSVSTLHTNPATATSSTASMALCTVLPECTAPCAAYNRLMYLNTEQMRQLFAHDRAVLSQYRQLCLPKTTPVRYNSSNINANTNNKLTDFPPLGGKAWDKSNKSQPNTPSGAIKPTAEVVGDTEALPFIQLALERQQLLESEFEAKLLQRGLVNSLMSESIGSVKVHTATDSTVNTTTSKLHYHVYQHTAGNLAYMHPICAKSIIETSIHSSSIAGVGNSGDGVHSIVPPKHSPRTQLQKKLQGKGTNTTHTTTNTTSTNPTISENATDTTDAADAIPSTDSVSRDTSSSSITTNTNTTNTMPIHLLTSLRARVIDSERVRVTADTRARYNVLRHLPLHTEVVLLEIDLSHIVPPHILCKYSEELNKRALRRKERAKQEKREKRLEQDRSMAEALLAQEHHDYLMQIREMELLQLDELHHGPTVAELRGNSSGTTGTAGTDTGGGSVYAKSDTPTTTCVDNTDSVGASVSASASASANDKKIFSFANITQMGGNFPTLGASQSKGTTTSSSASGAGAWGKSTVSGGASTSGSGANKSSGAGSGSGGDVWGRGSKPVSTANNTNSNSTGGSASGGKKEKKTKVVLMSNK